MTEDLRISMIQSHIIWEDREENLGYYGELLRRVSGRTDLAVLPETFTTGKITESSTTGLFSSLRKGRSIITINVICSVWQGRTSISRRATNG